MMLYVAEQRERAFVHKMSRKADNMHPCGAPVFITVSEESSVSVLTYCLLLVRKSNMNSGSLLMRI